jgi:hypothetical protein
MEILGCDTLLPLPIHFIKNKNLTNHNKYVVICVRQMVKRSQKVNSDKNINTEEVPNKIPDDSFMRYFVMI